MKTYLFAALSLMLWSSWSRAADYVVHVALIDDITVTEARVRRTETYLKKRYPELELRPVHVLAFEHSPAAITAKVRARLAEIPFTRGERVRLLVVNAPVPVEALDELKGKLSSYAHAVFLGHQGTEATSVVDLGAPDGSAFVLDTKPRRQGGFNLTEHFKPMALTSLGVGVSVAALALYFGENDAAWPLFFSWSMGTLGVLEVSTAVLSVLRPWLGVLSRRADFGRVVRFDEGRVAGQRRLSAWRRRVVYACQDALVR